MREKKIEAMSLIEYVQAFSNRGECQCDECIDKRKDQILEHSVEVGFFNVALSPYKGELPTKEGLIAKIKAHKGAFSEVNLFDGKEHNYMELGGWIGEQSVALQLMGMCQLLDAGQVFTPKKILGKFFDEETAIQLAQQGMLTLKMN